MAVLASLVDCISLCPMLKLQHYPLSLNGCFNPPTAPTYPHLPPHPPPACTSPIDSICDITGAEQTIQKTSSIQVL